MFARHHLLFCRAFSKARALRVAAPRRVGEYGIFFLQSFFFWASFLKRKSVIGGLVSIDSTTNYNNCLSFAHFFFGQVSAKKKFPKRNAVFCANAARATAFEKAVQNNRVVCANKVPYKSKFEMHQHPIRFRNYYIKKL